jgi:hypothetical protein
VRNNLELKRGGVALLVEHLPTDQTVSGLILAPTNVTFQHCLFELPTDGEVSNYTYVLYGFVNSKHHLDSN